MPKKKIEKFQQFQTNLSIKKNSKPQNPLNPKSKGYNVILSNPQGTVKEKNPCNTEIKTKQNIIKNPKTHLMNH